MQYRPEDLEKRDQIVYDRKAKNFELKKKLLPSLFEAENSEAAKQSELSETKKKKKAKQEHSKQTNATSSKTENKEETVQEKGKKRKATDNSEKIADADAEVVKNVPTKKRKKKGSNVNKKMKKEKRLLKDNQVPENLINISDARLAAYGIKAKKFKNKLKYGPKKL